MSNKIYTFLRVLIVAAFCFVVIHSFFITHSRTVRNDVIQGILLGFGMAFVALPIIGRIYAKKVNGWLTVFGCGEPGHSFLFRAACAQIFPGPVNIPKEAMYWTTKVDGASRALFGGYNYIIHFPAGQLPPNNAFWSLTMADAREQFVANPIKRYSVSDHSGLVPNTDGSVDIYIQNIAPTGHEANWLPAPTGNFKLWLRVYMPGKTILDRKYALPPVVKVN